jgi:hypothetical protein
LLRYKHRQFRAYLHQELARPIVCCLCCPRMTTADRIETLTPPLFLGVTCTCRGTWAYFSFT